MTDIVVTPKNSSLQYYAQRALEDLAYKEMRTVRGEDVAFYVDRYLEQGTPAVGITGEDLFVDYLLGNETDLEEKRRIFWDDPKALYNKPALCILVHSEMMLRNAGLIGNRAFVADKYMNIATKVLADFGDFETYPVSGCVEIGCSDGLADAIIDIVYTGDSMERYDLQIYQKIMTSDVLIVG